MSYYSWNHDFIIKYLLYCSIYEVSQDNQHDEHKQNNSKVLAIATPPGHLLATSLPPGHLLADCHSPGHLLAVDLIILWPAYLVTLAENSDLDRIKPNHVLEHLSMDENSW